MHPVILESLEEYLAGALTPGDQRVVEAHLKSCDDCRQQVQGMQEVSDLLLTLRPNENLAPNPGFAARVLARVWEQQPAPSVWGFLSLDAAFGRRVVFASLLTLAVLGGFLVSRETAYSPGSPNFEAIMATDQGSPAPNDGLIDRDRMLVTLASYEP
jgi:anti-sigma factor RsiW